MKVLAQGLVYSSVWIALCAMAMFENTSLWITGRLHFHQLNIYITASTLFLYSLHRLLSQRRIAQPFEDYKQWFAKYHNVVVFICAVSGITAVVDYFFLPWHDQLIFIVLGACALLYEIPGLVVKNKHYRLRDIGKAKMPAIILVWIGSTVLIPVYKFANHIPGALYPAYYTAYILAQICFFTVLCLSFDERDAVYDSQQGIKTWASRFSKVSLNRIYILLMLLYIILSAIQLYVYPFHSISMCLSVIATTVFTLWFVIRPSTHPLFHYVFVDGLMIIQCLFTYIAVHF